MSTPSKTKTEFQSDLAHGSINGSVDDILRVCRVISTAKESLTPDEFKDLRDDSPYSEKVWSKLLQIGLDDRLEGFKDHLPPLYTTIHLIHCLTDEELVKVYARTWGNIWPATDSSIRSRRSELVGMGQLLPTNETRKTRAGNRSIVWTRNMVLL